MSKNTAKSVLGELNPDQLGRTLTHEHLSMEYFTFYTTPKESDLDMSDCEWNLKNSGWIRQWPACLPDRCLCSQSIKKYSNKQTKGYSHKDNLNMKDLECENAVKESLKSFKFAGGGCVVENSTFGLHRKTSFLKELAEETGVNIIAGTGYYLEPSQNSFFANSVTLETMVKHMTDEINFGSFDCPDVKCGFIGEIGCCYPLYEFEKKAIVASAMAQEATGAPVSFHPGRDPEAPFEIMRIFAEAGGNTKKSICSHLERTIQDHKKLAEFASEFGSFCQFDLFGIENSYFQLKPRIDYPSDAQRIAMIQNLINEKFEDKILMAHDIHTKHRLESFGGHGYQHILNTTVPKMISKGISQDIIDKILISNPANILTF